ncbi:MAG: hypothetical protein A3J79_02050 [Elusimicrobia bacterium RIFOXYB2_FULL_62_6]|nr:MAG: hypothetical protein A3J79_02050 [Elusimicrobia bacterium RIFOXYB2_FULL_62_6]
MAAAEIKNDAETLDKLICDYGPTKYEDIVWAMEWARHLRWDEMARNLPMAELIEKAMLEVISGAVKPKDILAASSRDTVVTEKAAEKKDDAKKEKPEKEDKADAKEEKKKKAKKD